MKADDYAEALEACRKARDAYFDARNETLLTKRKYERALRKVHVMEQEIARTAISGLAPR